MADVTTVGTIELDVEFSDASISKEMEKLDKVISRSDLTAGFKNSIDGLVKGLNDFVKKDITNLTNSIKESMDELAELNKPPEIDTSQTENKFLNMFRRINIFAKDSIDKTTNDIRNFGRVGADSGNQAAKGIKQLKSELKETEDQINKTKDAIERLSYGKQYSGDNEGQISSSKYDAAISKQEKQLAGLESKASTLKQEITQLGNETESSGRKLGFFGRKNDEAGNSAEKASLKTRLFGNEMKNTSSKANGLASVINRSFKSILRRLFIYNVIMKGIRGVMDYMWAAMQTNAQFVASLNQIRTNLIVAFQPIFEFVLPALNALMHGIAVVTTYIATAISALFGKTYKQSFNAAKGMNQAMKSIGGVGKATEKTGKKAKKAGKAAKKAGEEAKKALAPFDEINQLDLGKDKGTGADDIPDIPSPGGGGGGAPGFEMTMPDMSAIDMTGIDKFKEIMSKIFEPFKLAWENEGQATIDAMKYAFGEIKELVKSIGASWLEVWTNGTGQELLESMLRILQLIFNIIGDTARATREAWDENERGTQLIQEFHNMLINILHLIESIGNSWRNAWNNGTGKEIMANILEILTNIVGVIGDIARSFETAWNTAGIGNAIMQHIQNIINHILELVNRLTGAFREVWGEVGDTLARVFLDTLRNILGVLDHLGEKLVWVWDHGGEHLFKGFLKLASKVLELAGYVINELIMPLAHGFIEIAGPAVAGLMDAIGYLLDIFTELIDWLLGDGKPVLDTIITVLKDMAIAFGIVKGAILAKNAVLAIYTGVLGVAKIAVTGFKIAMTAITSPMGLAVIAVMGIIAALRHMGVTFDDVKKGVKKFVKAVVAPFEWLYDVLVGHSIVPDLMDGIDGCFGGMFKKVTDTTGNLVNKVVGFFSSLKESSKNIWNKIADFMTNPIGKAKEGISSKVSSLKTSVTNKWGQIKSGISSTRRNLINAMMSPFKAADKDINGVVKNAKNWGKNLISNFTDGIHSMRRKVKDAVSSVASTVSDFLGFHSPAKKGPGSEADQWMPNLMGMLADGIEDNIYEVSAAVNMTAGSLEGVQNSSNSDNLANTISSAILGSAQSSEGGDTTIIVKIGEDALAEKVASEINRKSRSSGEAIIEI